MVAIRERKKDALPGAVNPRSEVLFVRFDPIQVEVWRHLFASIPEEMGAALERTGFSPNIKERRDHSCAIFDSQGRLLAQAAHIPVHLGAMPLMMERLLDAIPWSPGGMWLCNDPAHGGTHLPDLTLIAPVYLTVDAGQLERSGGQATLGSTKRRHNDTTTRLIGFVANRAHHADIGGIAPGSLPLSTEILQEGLIIPPVRFASGRRINQDILKLVCANSRTPAERRGDLAAQVAANQTGIRRFIALALRHGIEEFELRGKESRTYAESVVRATLSQAPDGDYSFTDVLDDDGQGSRDIPIRVTAQLHDGRVRFDFSGSAPETLGPVNATEAVTRSACCYVVRCLVDEDIPMNAGTFAPVEVIAPEGTVVNAGYARAVSAGNVETSQRIVDVLLGALARAFPDRIPAASQGTMNNLLIGGHDQIRGHQFAYYETIGGGAGGSARFRGASAIHTHMTNTRNTPIEALEMHYPLRVNQYSIRRDSGGKGRNPGGEGIVRSVELLSPAHVSIISERRCHAPGENTDSAAKRGRNRLIHPQAGESELEGKTSMSLPAGTTIIIETPGGAGWSEETK